MTVHCHSVQHAAALVYSLGIAQRKPARPTFDSRTRIIRCDFNYSEDSRLSNVLVQIGHSCMHGRGGKYRTHSLHMRFFWLNNPPELRLR